jgi:hypothetical protein
MTEIEDKKSHVRLFLLVLKKYIKGFPIWDGLQFSGAYHLPGF